VTGDRPAPGAVSAAPDAAPAFAARASVGRRAGALVYEALLLAALVLIAGFLLAPAVSPGAGPTHTLQLPSPAGRLASFCGVFVAAGVYCVWSWSNGRRTLPMKTWRLALRCADGTTVDRRTAARRYFACWIGPALALGVYLLLKPVGQGAHATWLIGLNFVWAVVDPERQFLHDRLAGTRIVTDRRPG
jgi:uncharacterized RDD family membrane protein YckC